MESREIRGRLLAAGNRLELEAAAARKAGDSEAANRLAGQRDAHYHLADALSEGEPAGVLGELPHLVELARQQAGMAAAQGERMRARSYARSAQVWAGVAAYWGALADAYGEAGKVLLLYRPGPMHPTDLQIGQEGTQVVRCPDCGQLEVWTEQECSDHGKCRAKAGPCWCEEGAGAK